MTDAAYQAAYRLVHHIDHELAHGGHYRDRADQALFHLDQVVRAILTDTLRVDVGAQTRRSEHVV